MFVHVVLSICSSDHYFALRDSNVFAESARTAADEEKKRAAAVALEEKQFEEAKRLSLVQMQQQRQFPIQSQHPHQQRQLPIPSQQHPFAQYPGMQQSNYPYYLMQQKLPPMPPVRGKAERQEEYNERVAVQVSNLMTDGTPTTKSAASAVLGHLCDTKMNPTNLVVRGASAVTTPAVGESPKTADLLVQRMKEHSINK